MISFPGEGGLIATGWPMSAPPHGLGSSLSLCQEGPTNEGQEGRGAPPGREVLLSLRFVPGERRGTGLLHQCIRKSGPEAPDTLHRSLGGAADQHAAALAPHHAGGQCQSEPGESRHR